MATPKTDIEQAVGRILRTKHIRPIVVDIVDNHDIFQNQWRKRKTFYMKNNYKIIKINSNDYNNQYNTWKISFDKKEIGSSIKEKDLVGKCFLKIK